MSSPNSLRESLVSASDADLLAAIATLPDRQIEALLYDWPSWARPEQLTPPGHDWRVWLILAGRGWGKTKTCAEDVKAYGLAHPGARIGIVAPTFADARDTCIEGESGLLACLPPGTVAKWVRSLGELVLRNGTRYKTFSADEPERLRGPQHHRLWFDEMAAWKYPQACYDMALFGLRLGMSPQVVIATTPRPIPLIRTLMDRAGQDVLVTKGRTIDNRDGLAPAFLSQIIARYAGTRLGRQELDAEILDDNPGALWQRDALEDARVLKPPALSRIVVAVDPAISSNEGSDETGIIAAGRTERGDGYVLEDASLRGTPHAWASAAVTLYHKLHADRIVAEANQGGAMVEHTIRTVDASVPVKLVHASRGKLTRAEPVAALYEQGRIHHAGTFPDLEDQQCNWTQGDTSPDRLDALVWALTELLIDGTREPSMRFFEPPPAPHPMEQEPPAPPTPDEIERQQAAVLDRYIRRMRG